MQLGQMADSASICNYKQSLSAMYYIMADYVMYLLQIYV